MIWSRYERRGNISASCQEVAVCEKCALYHSRKKSVPGEGPADSEIMFIGEGPGFYENEQGRPFVALPDSSSINSWRRPV